MGKQTRLQEKKVYIVPTSNGLQIAIIITDKDQVYANSDLLTEEKINLWFKTYYPEIDMREVVSSSQIPDKIISWAEKISLIRSGIDQDTSSIPLDLSGYTPKEKMVIEAACRHVPVDEYYTYGRVAELAGLPAAHRFVGSTMRKCRQPWIIPCQRIKNSKFVKSRNEPKVLKTPL